MQPRDLYLISYACGIGARNPLCQLGPDHIHDSSLLSAQNLYWQATFEVSGKEQQFAALPAIANVSNQLAETIATLIKQDRFVVTLGGDHTCAIGTWSGVASALSQPLGLIWIDAHLDSHTLETTPSGNIHGMPLAALLGYGDPALTKVLTAQTKLFPENVCVIGVRSYEQEEYELLKQLGVRIFFMAEINEKGLNQVFKEAMPIVTANTGAFGISLDLDAIDPSEAPGVGSPVPLGIKSQELYECIKSAAAHPRLVAADIAEFNPSLDKDQKTEAIIACIIHLLKGQPSYGE